MPIKIHIILSSVFLYNINISASARILSFIPTISYAHHSAFWNLWQTLSLKGHEVTVITSDPINNKSLTNLTEIDMNFLYSIRDANNIDEKVHQINNPIKYFYNFFLYENEVARVYFSHPKLKYLITGNGDFDVVIIETLFPEMFALSELYKCPLIAITSLDAIFNNHKMMGNSYHPILHPDIFLPMDGPLSLKERLISVYHQVYVEFTLKFIFNPFKDKTIHTFFPNNTLGVEQLMESVDILFVNANPVLHGVRPHSINTVYIGGGIAIRAPQPLSKDLKEFLDSAKEGAIYFSLGSNVKSRNLNGDKLNVIMDSLKSLPYKVLWKFENDELENKPPNVKIIKWAPQQDILRHPNIKLFVTQGGLQSIEEAIHFHVPMVVMPFFGDQGQNAKRIAHKEIGVEIEHKNLKKDEFLKAIHEVIDNPKYRENIVKLSKLMLDQPMTGIEKAVWWTEYVIRNKGAKHFKYPAWDIPFYQYYLLDVIGITVAVLLLVVISVFYATKTIYKCLKSLFVKRNKVKQK